MIKSISFVSAILSCGLVLGQVPEAKQPEAPVIDLGEVVSNVVIAKVQRLGSQSELVIAKFGRAPTPAKTKTVTTLRVEEIKQTVVVDGQEKEQKILVNIPVTTQVADQNFTPTEHARSVPVNWVEAFDINGKVVDIKDWTKALESPKHVLLLRSPITETSKLDPFFAKILREDILLLYIKDNSQEKKKD